MIKVVHLTTAHPPRDVRIFHKEARSLARAGYEVVIIAPADDSKIVDGVRIRAISKPDGRLRRVTVTQFALLAAAIRERADIYHFHDPELIFLGLLLRATGRKVVYDVHEDLPRQILQKPWIAAPLREPVARLTEAVEWLSGRMLSAIVAATPAISRRFPAANTVLVQNFPLAEEIATPPHHQEDRERCLLYYAGGIQTVRGARTMVEAVGLLSEEYRARLVLAGEFYPHNLQQELMRLPGWSRVQFLGWRERDRLYETMAVATMGLVLFHPLPNHVNAQPNKLFEYMAAGLPVVASDFPLWRAIIEPVRCGLLVDPSDSKAVADAISWLYHNPDEAKAMGRRGCQAVRERYNWNTEASSLLALYARLSSEISDDDSSNRKRADR